MNTPIRTKALPGFNGRVNRVGLMFLAAFLVLLNSLSAVRAQIPNSFADLAEQVSPAVVNITTSTIINRRSDMPGQESNPFNDLFNEFNRRNGGGAPEQERRGTALGSGFIISADGYVVTNNHVIEDADEIVIELFNGGMLDATVVGVDLRTDIALLKVESDSPLPFVSFGDSDKMRVGDWVLAIGNPLGQGFSVSAGIVSARGRTLSGVYDDFIQTDAAINKGNSGGPLFNVNGEVVGVNTAILSPSGGSIGIGFSMASAVVADVVDQLRQFGETRRGWLGVRIQNVTEDIADAMGLASASGAMVTDVPLGPAHEAGIEAGDVILSFDGKDVEDTRALVRMVAQAPVGDTVPVVVFRDGATQTVMVTLGQLEDTVLASADGNRNGLDQAPAQELRLNGMLLAPLNDETRNRFMIGEEGSGVVILEVDETSEAARKGLRPGDVIAQVSQREVSTPQDIVDLVQVARDAGRRSILLLVRSQGSGRFVALPLE